MQNTKCCDVQQVRDLFYTALVFGVICLLSYWMNR
jgi:hypothetical protein